jgi:peptidyl-prolyl cis-trans isomerase B (cyclophilin B)
MKSILTILAIAVLAIVLSYALSSTRGHGRIMPAPQDEIARKQMEDAKNSALPKVDMSETFAPNRTGVITATMTIKGRGDMTIELYPAEAPKAVAAITKLINAGYYNGLEIKSYAAGLFFLTGSPKYRVKGYPVPPNVAELKDIKIPHEKNGLKNVTGSLALAIEKSKSDFGGPRFFVNLKPNHPMDPDLPVFGKVVKNVEIAKAMKVGDVIDRFAIVK